MQQVSYKYMGSMQHVNYKYPVSMQQVKYINAWVPCNRRRLNVYSTYEPGFCATGEL